MNLKSQGGFVPSGAIYMVGEPGPEIIIPQRQCHPNKVLAFRQYIESGRNFVIDVLPKEDDRAKYDE